MDIEEIKIIIIESTNKIESNPNDADAYYNRGYYKSKLEDYKGAIADYDKVIEIDPNDAEAYENRSVIKSKLLDYKGALNDIKKSIEINPENAQHYWNSSVYKAGLRDFKGALADQKKASQLNPAYEEAPHLVNLEDLDVPEKKSELIRALKEMGYGKEDESEEKVYQEYGVANLNDSIKNQYSEDVHHVRLGINKRVDSYTRSGESEMEYTSIDYMLQIKLYYGEDYGYEDDYDTPGLGLVNIIINNSTGAILSESESGSIVFSDPISEESYFFDEFEELFDSDIENFGDQLKTEFNNAINSFEKDWVNNIKSDKDFKIELEKLFDFNKILTRLKMYQVKII